MAQTIPGEIPFPPDRNAHLYLVGNLPPTDSSLLPYPADVIFPIEAIPGGTPSDEPLNRPTRLKDGWRGLKHRWLEQNIKTYITLQSLGDEFETGYNDAETPKGKTEIAATTAIAVGGQIYERARLPEVFAAGVATNVYKESMERGHLSIFATLLGAAAVGALVYAQQKIIGKNMLRTAKHFPNTYDTAKQFWPEQLDFINNTLPPIDKPVQQGVAMVSFGTTPFVMTARANNPKITDSELSNIERKVTRRGSIASAGLGTVVLGSLSLAPHIPESVSVINPTAGIYEVVPHTLSKVKIPDWVAEQMVNKSQFIVDTLSSPTRVILGLAAFSGLSKLSSMLKGKKAETPTLVPALTE